MARVTLARARSYPVRARCSLPKKSIALEMSLCVAACADRKRRPRSFACIPSPICIKLVEERLDLYTKEKTICAPFNVLAHVFRKVVMQVKFFDGGI